MNVVTLGQNPELLELELLLDLLDPDLRGSTASAGAGEPLRSGSAASELACVACVAAAASGASLASEQSRPLLPYLRLSRPHCIHHPHPQCPSFALSWPGLFWWHTYLPCLKLFSVDFRLRSAWAEFGHISFLFLFPENKVK